MLILSMKNKQSCDCDEESKEVLVGRTALARSSLGSNPLIELNEFTTRSAFYFSFTHFALFRYTRYIPNRVNHVHVDMLCTNFFQG
jgi:hypothetical protein